MADSLWGRPWTQLAGQTEADSPGELQRDIDRNKHWLQKGFAYQVGDTNSQDIIKEMEQNLLYHFEWLTVFIHSKEHMFSL